jgi:hypothetical protein
MGIQQNNKYPKKSNKPPPSPTLDNALILKLFSNERNNMEIKKKTTKPQSIYEGRLFVCFVCTDEIHPIGGCFRLCSWFLWKALNEEGCIGLVSWCLDLRCKSS